MEGCGGAGAGGMVGDMPPSLLRLRVNSLSLNDSLENLRHTVTEIISGPDTAVTKSSRLEGIV